MKILKNIVEILLTAVGVIAAALLICFLNHRIRLGREDKILSGIGAPVTVDGHKMNVYMRAAATSRWYLCPAEEPAPLCWTSNPCTLF